MEGFGHSPFPKPSPSKNAFCLSRQKTNEENKMAAKENKDPFAIKFREFRSTTSSRFRSCVLRQMKRALCIKSFHMQIKFGLSAELFILLFFTLRCCKYWKGGLKRRKVFGSG
ncbi:hypothetical protein CDAR_180601 [Caerostris darwini]|uniref:Uncharacterized protein n=1 Tax=Caerostris darwini TaxID=1538125 RepID=A0AAV4UGD8_9ARAC|nr:hypothetical protein CDAR_180601 [Caerostris darwini]